MAAGSTAGHTLEEYKHVILHEIGHSLFDLRDEYDDLYTNWVGADPGDSNVTTEANIVNLKWKNLVAPELITENLIPTMNNPGCGDSGELPNVLDDDQKIGLFEGARRYHCGIYRPAYLCRMRRILYEDSSSPIPFCKVCIQAMVDTIIDSGIVTPSPHMEVWTENGSLLLQFGQVIHGLTMYRAFEVRNYRDGFPGILNVTLSSPSTEQFAYAPGTELSFTLPAPVIENYTSRKIFVSFSSPYNGGPEFFDSIQVETQDDPLNPSVNVDLQAEAVPPIPVDSVLVFDRSGSMKENTGIPDKKKVDIAIEAGKLYVSLLKDDDRIGIVRYNDTATDPPDKLLGMEIAGPQNGGQGRENAISVLTNTNLDPSGSTSIGAGLILGSEVLDTADADSRALIVLTDGRQNTLPDIPEASMTVSEKIPQQRVFAVGLGLNQLEDKLNQIASVTNGVAQITGDIVGYKEFILQKLFVQILSDLGDEAFVKDPLSVVLPGEKKLTDIYIAEVDITADFIVIYRSRSSKLEIFLESPDAKIIRPSDTLSMVNVTYTEESTFAIFRWVFPDFPEDPKSHIGRWRVWVKSHTQGPVFYSVMCKARSDLLLNGRLVQNDYEPNSKMMVVLEPTLFGQPVSTNISPIVKVVRPDNVTKQLSLSKNEYGQYTGEFNDTSVVGPYLFSAEVFFKTPYGNRVSRFRQFSGLIFHRGSGGNICKLIECILSNRSLTTSIKEVLQKFNINLEEFQRCLKYCMDK